MMQARSPEVLALSSSLGVGPWQSLRIVTSSGAPQGCSSKEQTPLSTRCKSLRISGQGDGCENTVVNKPSFGG